jgi:hypothetical protein
MTITLSSAKSLAPTCKAGGIWLHSPYDPAREAERFARSSIGSSKPSHILLLGPCLDYLTPAIRSALPGSRIISVQYSPFFAGRELSRPDAVWQPDSGESLESFLDANLDEDAISGVAVLEWEPATRAFPEAFAGASKAVASSLDRLSSSVATVKAFGKRWIANACASFLLIERLLTVKPQTCPVVVAAAGPSLNHSLIALSRFKGRFVIIAVSSAWSACLAAGIEPDLIVSTDGGYWSRCHLSPLARRRSSIASPLTALPSSSLYKRASFLVLNQGSFAELDLLPGLGAGFDLAPHGTVSGTAIHLASRISSGPIIAAGLDLASYGDLDHARPHGFDSLAYDDSSRFRPSEEAVWRRAVSSSPDLLEEGPWRD